MAEVAIAILYRENKLLMQLRDNIPTILYPGWWGLFGGHIEPGESPLEAVVREITEEICYDFPQPPKFFGIYADEKVYRHVFFAELMVPLSDLKLCEGWDFKLLSKSEIESGKAFSPIADQFRDIGIVHQKILSDFIDRYPDAIEK
jgi:8-oxo-dGTP pyrophosphatase MutT (NUDIX family)